MYNKASAPDKLDVMFRAELMPAVEDAQILIPAQVLLEFVKVTELLVRLVLRVELEGVNMTVTLLGGDEPMLIFTDWQRLTATEKLEGSIDIVLLETRTVVEVKAVLPVIPLTATVLLR